jgi:hypothetical protein
MMARWLLTTPRATCFFTNVQGGRSFASRSSIGRMRNIFAAVSKAQMGNGSIHQLKAHPVSRTMLKNLGMKIRVESTPATAHTLLWKMGGWGHQSKNWGDDLERWE